MLPNHTPNRHNPTVSIVLPVFNVARFLQEALHSVENQDMTNLEILCIDDGSTDWSPEILARHASEDPRIVVHGQANAGLGAARNAGLQLSTGHYIMFVDSDDRLPLDAVSLLLGSLRRTGSDFAVGKIRRFTTSESWRSALTTSAFDAQKDHTHISETPELVYDTVAVNKLFRRDFLDRIAFRFPEGVAFEDMDLIARAHLEAGGVDLLPRWVYEWRQRPDSITADRFGGSAFYDRIQALEKIHTRLGEAGLEQVRSAFLSKLINFDQMVYARSLDPANDEHLRAFADGFGGLYRRWPQASVTSPAPWHRRSPRPHEPATPTRFGPHAPGVAQAPS
ncbi:MAG: glycosyltransferase family 2 protein [Microthrixaceae bacterium]